MLSIGVPLQGIQMNLNARKKQLQTLIIAGLKHFLNNVVSKWILHHGLKNLILASLTEYDDLKVRRQKTITLHIGAIYIYLVDAKKHGKHKQTHCDLN